MLKVSIVCSDRKHPAWSPLGQWAERNNEVAEIELVTRCAELSGGDILFLISCSELVRAEIRDRYTNVFVVHASDLPKRRGWSPYIWALLEGETDITVTLLAAEDPVDSGNIYQQLNFPVDPHELLSEVMDRLIAAELDLMDWAVAHFGRYTPREQVGEPSWCPRRGPDDSRIDPDISIAAQFDVIRLSDPDRFPAFFDLHGVRYAISLKKMENIPQ
jgi:methionyl-tRNA formyltransferase